MTFVEDDLEIDVTDATNGRRFDGDDHGLSHCMRAVDFVVELEDRHLFIEVKDPQHPRATLQSRSDFVAKTRSGWLDEELKYKCRNSFLYEWASQPTQSTPNHYPVQQQEPRRLRPPQPAREDHPR